MYKKEKVDRPFHLFVWIEKYQHSWLKKEAQKRKLSISSLIRYYISYFIKKDGKEI